MTAEVVAVQDLSAAEARELTDKIRTTLQFGHKLISEAFMGRAWVALGYESWDSYCAGEFTEARMIRLDREQRREIVADLRVQGMSTRAIGTALGVHHDTVAEDVRAVAGVGNPTPRITGSDGKSYAPTQPSTDYVDRITGEVQPIARERAYAPRTDVVRVMNAALGRAQDAAEQADQIKREHLVNRNDEAAVWSRDLAKSMQSIQRLLDLLTEVTR